MKRAVFMLLVISSLLSARDYMKEAEQSVNSYKQDQVNRLLNAFEGAIKHHEENLADTNKYTFEQCIQINFKAINCSIDYADKIQLYKKANFCISKITEASFLTYHAPRDYVLKDCIEFSKTHKPYFDLVVKHTKRK